MHGASGGSFAGQVYDSAGVSPTLTDMQGGGRQPHVVTIEKLGYIDKGNGSHESNEVIDSNGLCSTICAGQGVKYWINHVEVKKMEQQIVAMRGRDKDNPNHRGPATENYEQRLEPNENGVCNTITSVQKDNMVLETANIVSLPLNDHDDGTCRTIKNQYDKTSTINMQKTGTFGASGVVSVKTIKIRQATKDGFIDCELPGVADLNYPDSQTRRGRVLRGGQISPTLTTENIPSVIEMADSDFYNFLYEIDGEIYMIRIRKLIPLETWRLMGFSDEDFHKAESVNSNTQLYKEAGNSIVKNCLVAIFGQMFEGKEDFYKS